MSARPAPGTHRERATEGFPGVREREEKGPRKARDGRWRFLELPETFYPEGAYAQERLRQLQESPPLGTSRAAVGVGPRQALPTGPREARASIVHRLAPRETATIPPSARSFNRGGESCAKRLPRVQ